MATHDPNLSQRVRRFVALAVVALLTVSCGDDDDEADGSVADTTGTSPSSGVPGASGGPIDPMAAAVEVTGDALPLLPDDEDDPAVGSRPPTLAGMTYDGEPIEIAPESDGAMMLVFLAHWCPHCNAEIPVLLEWRDAGMIPEGLEVVGVSTGVRNDAPNFPPDEWLAEMGWDWPVLADSPASNDSAGAAADAYGLTRFPFFALIGDDGTVKVRAGGERSLEELDALAAEALAT